MPTELQRYHDIGPHQATVVRCINRSIGNLQSRYTDLNADAADEILKEIKGDLSAQSFGDDFKAGVRACLRKIEAMKEIPEEWQARGGVAAEMPILLKETLALVWKAIHDETLVKSEEEGQQPEESEEEQQRIELQQKELQRRKGILYKHMVDASSMECPPGIQSLLLETLAQTHPDVTILHNITRNYITDQMKAIVFKLFESQTPEKKIEILNCWGDEAEEGQKTAADEFRVNAGASAKQQLELKLPTEDFGDQKEHIDAFIENIKYLDVHIVFCVKGFLDEYTKQQLVEIGPLSDLLNNAITLFSESKDKEAYNKICEALVMLVKSEEGKSFLKQSETFGPMMDFDEGLLKRKLVESIVGQGDDRARETIRLFGSSRISQLISCAAEVKIKLLFPGTWDDSNAEDSEKANSLKGEINALISGKNVFAIHLLCELQNSQPSLAAWSGSKLVELLVSGNIENFLNQEDEKYNKELLSKIFLMMVSCYIDPLPDYKDVKIWLEDKLWKIAVWIIVICALDYFLLSPILMLFLPTTIVGYVAVAPLLFMIVFLITSSYLESQVETIFNVYLNKKVKRFVAKSSFITQVDGEGNAKYESALQDALIKLLQGDKRVGQYIAFKTIERLIFSGDEKKERFGKLILGKLLLNNQDITTTVFGEWADSKLTKLLVDGLMDECLTVAKVGNEGVKREEILLKFMSKKMSADIAPFLTDSFYLADYVLQVGPLLLYMMTIVVSSQLSYLVGLGPIFLCIALLLAQLCIAWLLAQTFLVFSQNVYFYSFCSLGMRLFFKSTVLKYYNEHLFSLEGDDNKREKFRSNLQEVFIDELEKEYPRGHVILKTIGKFILSGNKLKREFGIQTLAKVLLTTGNDGVRSEVTATIKRLVTWAPQIAVDLLVELLTEEQKQQEQQQQEQQEQGDEVAEVESLPRPAILLIAELLTGKNRISRNRAVKALKNIAANQGGGLSPGIMGALERNENAAYNIYMELSAPKKLSWSFFRGRRVRGERELLLPSGASLVISV
jgi:hypothetical protein